MLGASLTGYSLVLGNFTSSRCSSVCRNVASLLRSSRKYSRSLKNSDFRKGKMICAGGPSVHHTLPGLSPARSRGRRPPSCRRRGRQPSKRPIRHGRYKPKLLVSQTGLCNCYDYLAHASDIQYRAQNGALPPIESRVRYRLVTAPRTMQQCVQERSSPVFPSSTAGG